MACGLPPRSLAARSRSPDDAGLILGSHGMAAHEYPEMLARVADGRLRPDRLVGRTISLDEAPAALVAMGGPSTGGGMTVIVPG